MVLIKLNPNGENQSLPLMPKEQTPSMVQVHPLPSQDGLLVKIQPPKTPSDGSLPLVASPCDLVLSIDISGSMGSNAPVPEKAGEESPEYGLSVLDLVKHAARTIIETLDEKDRLGIVTFASQSQVLQPLVSMTPANKADTLKKIDEMVPRDLTNLWHGIRDGLNLFRDEDGNPTSGGRVPALLVLTDGVPNYMCPQQGYVPKLQSMGPLPATIHTFGFGYQLRSALLKSISGIGGGNYSFIPDAGMIGTVFVHAVANLQSTFVTKAKLRLTYPSYLQLEETTGEAVEKQAPVELEGDVPEPLSQLTILLSNIQYGQSRDIYLRYGNGGKTSLNKKAEDKACSPPTMTAVLEYEPIQVSNPTIQQISNHQNLLEPSSPALDPAEIAYHISRSLLIAHLTSAVHLDPEPDHSSRHVLRPAKDAATQLANLARLLSTLPATNFPTDPNCHSLLVDLCGPSPPTTNSSTKPDPSTWTGQIALALANAAYYHRWGVHYLPSLAGAHARQVCNSFKDAGPLRYGVDSPPFIMCRDRLDAAFDALPAPVPSIPVVPKEAPGQSYTGGCGTRVRPQVSMRRYNDRAAGCFAGCVRVVLEGGRKTVRIGKLRTGVRVLTPKGPRRVVAVVRMPVRGAEMCLVGEGMLITPWHPVAMQQGDAWVFPKDVKRKSVRYTGAIYSVLLERDEDAEAHAILVGGVWGVTLGHGLTEGDKRRDVRVHEFFGNYDKVCRSLVTLPRRSGGLVLGGGVTRDPESGLIDGFMREDVGHPKALLTRAKTAAYA